MKYIRKCAKVKKYALQRANCANPLVFSSTYVTINVFKANTFGHLGERMSCWCSEAAQMCVLYRNTVWIGESTRYFALYCLAIYISPHISYMPLTSEKFTLTTSDKQGKLIMSKIKCIKHLIRRIIKREHRTLNVL